MFGGKTEELIKRLMRASRMGKRVEVYKPRLDTRYSQDEVVSHGGLRIPAHVVEGLPAFTGTVPDVVGIDEGQFFGESLVPAVEALLSRGVRVIVSGLDLNSQGKPFEPMPTLLAMADEVVKLRAVCAQCLKEASRSYLYATVTPSQDGILVGGAESYEPRCFACFTRGMMGEIQEGVRVHLYNQGR